jgi:hypothetical protein
MREPARIFILRGTVAKKGGVPISQGKQFQKISRQNHRNVAGTPSGIASQTRSSTQGNDSERAPPTMTPSAGSSPSPYAHSITPDSRHDSRLRGLSSGLEWLVGVLGWRVRRLFVSLLIDLESEKSERRGKRERNKQERETAAMGGRERLELAA